MPTPISFDHRRVLRHDWNETWRHSLLLLVVGMAVFLVLIPISTAGMPATSIFNLEYTHDQLKYRFYDAAFAPVVYAAVLVYGALLGIALLRFLHDRRQTATYFSLGISRVHLLLIRLGTGGVMLAAAIGVPLLVSLVLNLAALGYTASIFSSCLYLFLGLYVSGLVSLFVTAIACALAGTLLEAVLFSGCLLAIPSALFYGLGVFSRHLLFGNAAGALYRIGTTLAAPSLFSQFAALNPLLFFYTPSVMYSIDWQQVGRIAMPAIHPLVLILWAMVATVFAIWACVALRARKGEYAGVFGMCAGMNVTFALTLDFFLFALLLDMLAALNLAVAFLTATAAFVLVWVLLRKWMAPSLHAKKRALRVWILPVELAVIYLVVLIYWNGLFGFSSAVPNAEDVSSAQISYVGTPNYITGDTTQGSASGGNYLISQLITLKSRSDIQTALSLHKNLINAGKPALVTNPNVFSHTAVPYDILIKYNLKNGGTLTRYYDRATFDTLEQMFSLDSTAAVKQLETATITGKSSSGYWAAGAYQNGAIYLSSRWYTGTQKLALDTNQRTALLAALAEDVTAQTVSDRYTPSAASLGVLMFSQSGDSDTTSFAYNLENTVVYLTNQFTHTLAFLHQNGLDSSLNVSTPTVESVQLMKYDPYVSVNRAVVPVSRYFMGYIAHNVSSFSLQKDFGKNTIVDQADKIAKILPHLQNTYYVGEGGYLAAVKLANSDQYDYFFLPMTQLP